PQFSRGFVLPLPPAVGQRGRGRRVGDGGFQTARGGVCHAGRLWDGRGTRETFVRACLKTEPGVEARLAATRDNGQVPLTLTGKQGSRYAIETSTALPNWNSADLFFATVLKEGVLLATEN